MRFEDKVLGRIAVTAARAEDQFRAGPGEPIEAATIFQNCRANPRRGVDLGEADLHAPQAMCGLAGGNLLLMLMILILWQRELKERSGARS